jgi:hypothetical protein
MVGWVFSIPKRLRIYFVFHRSFLTKLSRCAWKVLNLYLIQAVPYDDAKAGAAAAFDCSPNPVVAYTICSGGFFLTNNDPSAIHSLPESRFLSPPQDASSQQSTFLYFA